MRSAVDAQLQVYSELCIHSSDDYFNKGVFGKL